MFTLLFTLQTASPAKAEEPFDRQNIRFLYTENIVGNNDPVVKNKLQQLRNSGINTIQLSRWSVADFAQDLARIRADAVLSQFKVVLAVNGPTYDAWFDFDNHADVCRAEAEYIPDDLKMLLDGVIALASANQDIVVGYYTFDEPALYVRNGQKGICKKYQELIYDYIRQRDNDLQYRPVIIANTMHRLNDADIEKSLSTEAQDLIFIDQYDHDENSQVQYFEKWKQYNLLTDPVVYVLPAKSNQPCADPELRLFSAMLDRALTTVFGDDKPISYGDAYFAFWPDPKPDFNYGADNCEPIFDSVVDHLTVRPDLQVTNIKTVQPEFRPGDAVTFEVEIKNLGPVATDRGWIGVLMLDNESCFSTGCNWGGFVGVLASGESKIITMNVASSGYWHPSAGVHAITAMVDDQQRIQESNETNNRLLRTINVSDKPDLIVNNLTTVPAEFQPGAAIGFSVSVTNIGSVATPPGQVTAAHTVDGLFPSSECCWSGGTIPSIAPGETVVLQSSSEPWIASAGQHTITTYLDDWNFVAESDDTNNSLSRIINVSDKPDLIITNVTTSPATISKAGDAVSFDITVKNIGSKATPNGWLGAIMLIPSNYVWGGAVRSLAPDETVTIKTYNKAWNPASGTYYLTAFVDDGLIAESNENNNTKVVQVVVP